MRVFTDSKILTFITKYFKLAFNDLKRPQMIFLSLLPVGLSLVIWAIFFIFSITNFSFYIGQFPNIWVDYAMNFETFFAKISYYLLYFFAIVTMIFYGIIIFGVCNVLISACLAPFVVSFVHKNHYAFPPLNPPNFIESIKISSLILFKTFIPFALWSALCYLLSFVGLGFIGLILSIFVYFRFFSVNLNYEIALNIMPLNAARDIISNYKIPLSTLNLLIFIPLYIPILNLFLLVWQMLIITHFLLEMHTLEYMINHTEDVIEIQSKVVE
ncbi:hypothetical protein DCO58_08495 [Helicobacter saguini]|uniref:Peptidase n=1 Tax=Helicobacter saguini TaxID=1548018 RepID=A0A347VNU3_9HELI|nr:EI24 domain-containing protein [Helicobacter saguini]MWV61638.1 hypothetical protein [Helicobacter saguini]MWV67690.1 hypothetical protein [Helicobacter saguini]MWV70042.1 hypothetical protein [Helicobacter saguini]MWV72745.1 hypothetical protein [Helicobacter saguini]TLD92744.1 hypothetical protein LS64_009990 [Helicobacter saguini]